MNSRSTVWTTAFFWTICLLSTSIPFKCVSQVLSGFTVWFIQANEISKNFQVQLGLIVGKKSNQIKWTKANILLNQETLMVFNCFIFYSHSLTSLQSGKKLHPSLAFSQGAQPHTLQIAFPLWCHKVLKAVDIAVSRLVPLPLSGMKEAVKQRANSATVWRSRGASG